MRLKVKYLVLLTQLQLAALTTFENKIPNVKNLVKKADYDAKISEMENTYFTTSDYNKFTSNALGAKIGSE